MAALCIKKKQIRFSFKDDLNLLKRSLHRIPSAPKTGQVSAAVSNATDKENFQIDARRARERTGLLLEQFKSDENQAVKRSGCEEELTEMKQLLQEIVGLQEEERRKSQKESTSAENKAKEIRKRALESLTPKKDDGKDNEGGTPVKRSSSASIISYLKDKVTAENKLKEEEIEIRKEELKLERERFELEKTERMQKIESDRQQNNLMMELMKQFVKDKH